MGGQKGQIKLDVSGGVLGRCAVSGVFKAERGDRPMGPGEALVSVPYNSDLFEVLMELGNTAEADEGWTFWVDNGDIKVVMEQSLDARLEELIAGLGRLRWGYEPGRVVQLALIGEFVP